MTFIHHTGQSEHLGQLISVFSVIITILKETVRRVKHSINKGFIGKEATSFVYKDSINQCLYWNSVRVHVA